MQKFASIRGGHKRKLLAGLGSIGGQIAAETEGLSSKRSILR